MSTALTTREQRDLEVFEDVVQRGLDTFVEVGRALAEIRDRKLYRQSHDSFEEYCGERWLLGRTRAYQLIDAAKVNGAMSTIVDTPPPANEAQARELAPVLRDEGEQAVVEVWRELRAEYGDRVTARLVKVEVEEWLARKPKRDCPGCGRLVLVDRVDVYREIRPGTCLRCGNTLPEIENVVVYEVTTERQRQLAEKAAKRFWSVITNRSPVSAEPVHELIRLDRALAVLTDEEIDHAIEELEKGMAETKAMVAELRRHRGSS